MSCTIVPIAEEHIAGFHAALDAVAKEKNYLAFTAAPPLEKSEAFVRSNIRSGHPQFVALDGDRVVGWCDIIPIDRASQAHTGVLGIGLLPAFRGRGIGRQLMIEAIAAGRKNGLTRIELTVRENNLNAVALYKKLGFDVEGVKRNASLIDGVYENVIMMGLLSPLK